MKKTMKQGGLLVLSTMALGTAVVPVFGTNTIPAQAASADNSAQKDVVYKLKKLDRYVPLNVFNYAKAGVLTQIATLPVNQQAFYKRELQQLENTNLTYSLSKKYDVLSSKAYLLRNIDVNYFAEQVSRIAVNERGYQQAQEQAKRLKEMKARLDVENFMMQARYGVLSPTELKDLDKAVSQLPANESTSRKEMVSKLKNEQQMSMLLSALFLADKVPDKAFIAKVKKDVNAMPASSLKENHLKKIVALEKKQRVYTAKEFQERMTTAVGDVRFGQFMVPTYVKDVVTKELSELKTKNVNKYLAIATPFYGKEVESYSRYLDNKRYVTKDDLIVVESKLSAFKKSTGMNDNNPYQRNLERYQKEEYGTMHARIQSFELNLPEGEFEDSLRRAALLNENAYASLLRDVDRVRATDAGGYIDYYVSVGRYTMTKQADYDMAVKKINQISDANLRQMMLQKLNRYQ